MVRGISSEKPKSQRSLFLLIARRIFFICSCPSSAGWWRTFPQEKREISVSQRFFLSMETALRGFSYFFAHPLLGPKIKGLSPHRISFKVSPCVFSKPPPENPCMCQRQNQDRSMAGAGVFPWRREVPGGRKPLFSAGFCGNKV